MVNTAMLVSCPWCSFFFCSGLQPHSSASFLIVPIFHACFVPLHAEHPTTVTLSISAVGKRCQEHNSQSLHLNKVHNSDHEYFLWQMVMNPKIPLRAFVTATLATIIDFTAFAWKPQVLLLVPSLFHYLFCMCLLDTNTDLITYIETPGTVRSSSGTKDCIIT